MALRPGRCVVDGQPSDGRRFCSPRCYLKFPDGREKRPSKGIDVFVAAVRGEEVSFFS